MLSFRSRPPSPIMSQRTRKIYVKRSAPAKIGAKAAKKASKIQRRQNAAARRSTSLCNVPTLSFIPPPDVIARRDMKQHKLGTDTSPKLQADKTQSEAVDNTQSLSMDQTQPDASDKTQSERSEKVISESKLFLSLADFKTVNFREWPQSSSNYF